MGALENLGLGTFPDLTAIFVPTGGHFGFYIVGFICGESYLAEQFRQITRYLAEQFRQITHYLAEQFRQITRYLWEQFCQIEHYLVEHLIQKNNILLNEQFLTL